MDIAVNHFETELRRFVLLDAPGHRDFIPNMISGAAQADVAVLVVSAQRGEFESGFSDSGQTKEHAVLVRSLGVSQVVVAVNKMDLVGWDQARYESVVRDVHGFLLSSKYKTANIRFVPCSGLSGSNLTTPLPARAGGDAADGDDGTASDAPWSWYSGPTLLQALDGFEEVARSTTHALRVCVSDVFRSPTSSLGSVAVAAKVEGGIVKAGNRLVVVPGGLSCVVKGIHVAGGPVRVARAGETADIGLTGVDMTALAAGQVLCRRGALVPVAKKVRMRLFTLDALRTPLVEGQQLTAHMRSVEVPCNVTRLIHRLAVNSRTGKRTKIKHPRFVVGAGVCEVKLRFEKATPLELYSEHPRLGRLLLRQGGVTVAAGMVVKIIK